MKKLLGIVVLGLLLSSNAFIVKAAEDNALGRTEFVNNVTDFNMWLNDNDYHQYLNLEPREVCKGKKNNAYYIARCNLFEGSNNLKIKFYKNRWQVPFKANPNRDTLIYYLWKTINHPYSFTFHTYEIKPSNNPYEFKSNLRKDEHVKKEIKQTGVLSYLLFENDEIVIDEKSPDLGEFFNDKTKLRSNSMGKSMVGYLAGHAICSGYIDSIDTKLNDWPLIEKTLYHDQRLIDLLNMNTGDQKYGTYTMWDGTSNDDKNLVVYMQMMEGKKKSKSEYNYNTVVTNIIFNYIKHKTGDQFENFLEDVFQRHVKIKNSVIFYKSRDLPDSGRANSMFYADRYDYLRIAKTIMEDYQSNNCVGKYLKDIYERKVVKGANFNSEPSYGNTKTYGGQFHFDYPGLKDRPIFGMSGYAGNAILIDPETSTIVALNSIHYNIKKSSIYNYDVKKLLIQPIQGRK
jgi:hypothetical protein